MNKHKYSYEWLLKEASFTKDKGKVFSCFACGGGSTMGYKLAGFDVVGCNEIDPKMMECYITNHHPKYSFLEPIQEFKNKELPDELFELDILDGSPPCFDKSVLVHTNKGFVFIDKVKKGDFVLTHLNQTKEVITTMQRDVDFFFNLKIQGSLPFGVTAEHPFYVRTMERNKNKRFFTNPYWKQTKDLIIKKAPSGETLKQDYIGVAINKKETIPDVSLFYKREKIDLSRKDFWYLIGRYLGDGWLKLYKNNQKNRITVRYKKTQEKCLNCENLARRNLRCKEQWTSYCSEKCRSQYKRKQRKTDRNTVIICCGKHEKFFLEEKIKQTQFNFSITEERTVFKFHIFSKDLCAYLTQFGRGAKNKELTNDVLNLPVNLLESFLDGYLDADGCYNKKIKKWSCCSISKKLITGIQHCIYKVYNQPTTFSSKDNSKYNQEIEGRKIKTNMAFALSFFKSKKKQQHGFYENGYIWLPYRRKEKIVKKIKVFNLSIKDDESYTVNNYICHNCSSFTMAGNREKDWGKKKKFREGQAEQVLDTLFFDFIDLTKRLQPKVVIAENVKGLLIGEAKKYLHKILKEFDKAGYYISYKLLDASFMGVPQKRQRVFFYGLRKDLMNEKIGFFDLFETEPSLDLTFNEDVIPINKFVIGVPKRKTQNYSEKRYGDVMLKLNKPSTTIATDINRYWIDENTLIDEESIKKIGSYPLDYNFLTNKTQYLIGMSVPPVMMAQIADRIYKQWLSKL